MFETQFFTSSKIFQFTDPKTLPKSNKSEDVVYFPESVANRQQRISLTVYRKDSVFPDAHKISVNSLILDINVENVTKFDHGEVSIINVACPGNRPTIFFIRPHIIRETHTSGFGRFYCIYDCKNMSNMPYLARRGTTSHDSFLVVRTLNLAIT